MKNILSAVLIALLVSVLMPFAKTKSNLQSLTFIRSPRSQQSITINNPATIICKQTLSVPSSILISKLSVIVCVCLCLSSFGDYRSFVGVCFAFTFCTLGNIQYFYFSVLFISVVACFLIIFVVWPSFCTSPRLTSLHSTIHNFHVKILFLNTDV